MLFFSFFKTLVDQEVTVELKNDIEIKGTLKSVDQFLNLKLDNISCANESKYPHLRSVKNLFIRGSTVRYVHMNANSVDCTLLQDASRRGMFSKEFLAASCILTISQKPWFRPPSEDQIILMYYRRGASFPNKFNPFQDAKVKELLLCWCSEPLDAFGSGVANFMAV